MNNIDQTRLARLRPEKLDDVFVKEQISLIQQACGNVSPEKIALVFHECDYNMQQTINRIRAGDFEDSGWQTAKSNNKKKNHNSSEQKLNGNNLSDSERSLSQRTSPTSSLRDGQRRYDHYQPIIRQNTAQRRNDSGRSHFIPSNQRYSYRNRPMRKTTSFQPIVQETPSTSKELNEEPPITNSPSTDEYEFADGIPKSLSFDNSHLKASSIPPITKRRTPSSIPQQPVSMHPIIPVSSGPIDVQFGDVLWNDSVPIAVSPSNNEVVPTKSENENENIITNEDTENHEQDQDLQDSSASNHIPHQIMNEADNPLVQTANQFSSLSINDNVISTSVTNVPLEGSSHLSDHLNDTSSPIPNQYSLSQQQQVAVSVPIARLPPTSTPRAPEHSSSNSQLMLNNIQQNNNGMTSSAFTPFNAPVANYPTIPRDYSQTATNWNSQTSNYKANTKQTMIPTATYPTPVYQIPNQQQPILVGTYSYPSISPAVVPVFASIDQWPSTAFATPYDTYPYTTTTNYIAAYPNPNQQQYPKYDHIQPHGKDFFTYYGQTRSTNNDAIYQQQQQQSPQPTKDTHVTSKLSPNAAVFCQGAPLTASPTAAATAVYFNPLGFSIPNYYPTIPGTVYQDRTLSSVDNRDNRNGASYSGTNNRNSYYYGQQQRTHNNN